MLPSARWFLTVLLLAHLGNAALASDREDLRVTDFFVAHISNDPFYSLATVDNRVSLHVREVVAAGGERSAAVEGRVLLLIHGATIPGYVAFDSDEENCSLMRFLARAGWDTFAVDLEGFGLSTRPGVMDAPGAISGAKAPMRLDVTIRNVERAVEFISNLRGVEKVHILGWSQGASLEAPLYAIRHPHRVSKLVLFGGTDDLGRSAEDRARIAAEREAKKVDAITPDVKAWAALGTEANLVLPACFDAYKVAHLASDPKSSELGGKVRFPTGRSVDTNAKPLYDASRITVPTLLIRGDADKFATGENNRQLLSKLSTGTKRLVEIPDAGHFIQFEKTQRQFFESVKAFLDEVH